jgi:hypothetical protein
MKRFSNEVYHLMVLIPFFASLILSFVFYYFNFPNVYSAIINSILLCVVGLGGCGLFVSRGKGYLWKDYFFILFVSLAVTGSILFDFYRGAGELMYMIGLLGGIVLFLGKKNTETPSETKEPEKKEQGWKHYLFIASLVLTCIGILFTRFHWPYGKMMITYGLAAIVVLWLIRKWKDGLYKGNYEDRGKPE